ncbi:Uma2 family endonuclease [Streptacidiphilus fuscans]|uniref:Uma2 family endonuclease n=1 Tax=Streptacidiphilus fuscans TaxID=2789292 RepID=A0A931B4B1_9ACTN|nr:Uma2 family endonuclease [Streptacidiphilus fuscans]MBF9070960.1 Uma2 family endonuclease [Streptacidiphilus fuscans]
MAATEHSTQDSSHRDLVDAVLNLSVSEGFRTELTEGKIIVSPPSDGAHGTLISNVARQLHRHAELDVDFLPNKGLVVPGCLFVPGGTVVAAGRFRDAEPWADPLGVLLVLEVSSTRPDMDREAKRLAYAKADIPCYLLVDRAAGKVTLFTNPEQGDYQTDIRVSFGKPIDLPEPFSFRLDTTPFT